jgi:hypothetical protein
MVCNGQRKTAGGYKWKFNAWEKCILIIKMS